MSDPRHLKLLSRPDGHLPGGVQALARLHQPQCEGALRLPHCPRSEEATVPHGPEERAIRLHCQVPQVQQKMIGIIISICFSFIIKTEEGDYYE